METIESINTVEENRFEDISTGEDNTVGMETSVDQVPEFNKILELSHIDNNNQTLGVLTELLSKIPPEDLDIKLEEIFTN